MRYSKCLKVAITTAFLATFSSLASHASCQTTPYRFHFGGDTTANSEMDSHGCSYGFQAGGTTTFSGASVGAPPEHGTLKQTTTFNFVYTPKAGYKGDDNYSIKVCGQSRANTGCSTINYSVTVK
jgi:hypothetical protein